MPRTIQYKLSPRLAQATVDLGQNIRLARQRRRLTMQMVAERAGISRVTLSKIEHGDPSVTMGAYASVLFVLGLEQQLQGLAADDALGRKLQDLSSGQRVRRSASSMPPGQQT